MNNNRKGGEHPPILRIYKKGTTPLTGDQRKKKKEKKEKRKNKKKTKKEKKKKEKQRKKKKKEKKKGKKGKKGKFNKGQKERKEVKRKMGMCGTKTRLAGKKQGSMVNIGKKSSPVVRVRTGVVCTVVKGRRRTGRRVIPVMEKGYPNH